MTKIICNSEAVMPKKSANAKLFMATIVGSALLPLSALAVLPDDNGTSKSLAPSQIKNADNTSSSKDDKTVVGIDAESIKRNGAAPATTIQPSQLNTANTNSSPATTSPSYNADNLNSTDTVEKPIATSPKKTPFWKNTDYLLSGGALLLILGGALLIFRKISALSAENRILKQENISLTKDTRIISSKLKQSNTDNEQLKAELNHQRTMHDEQNNAMHNTFGTAPIIDAIDETPIIEDLNAADRKQLSESITKWFTTNRGNTKVHDLVPVDIKRKLEHLHYTIELWTGSDGVDSVELTQHTMRASVISLTKPDRQGFSYCYKKPNALSTVWVNKAWYQVQRTDRTLEVLSAPLEIN